MGGAYAFSSSGSDTESTEANIDSESDYDLESLMDTDVVSYPLPENVEELRLQLLTPRACLPLLLAHLRMFMCLIIIGQPPQLLFYLP